MRYQRSCLVVVSDIISENSSSPRQTRCQLGITYHVTSIRKCHKWKLCTQIFIRLEFTRVCKFDLWSDQVVLVVSERCLMDTHTNIQSLRQQHPTLWVHVSSDPFSPWFSRPRWACQRGQALDSKLPTCEACATAGPVDFTH